MNKAFAISIIVLCGALSGCMAGFGEQAEHGITFYCPGAGNVDMGDAGIREGLKKAGYRGQVARLTWTVSFNPAIDQAVRVNARVGAARLADYIKQYIDKYPGRAVNVVGLSAGTGVAIWALEDLPAKYQVDSVILIASSLSSRYDVRKALRRVKGNIYCYYSANDIVLAGPMKLFGTIDGVFGQDGAGAVGLHPPGGRERVMNICWRPEFQRYGYSGGHTDGTSPAFVAKYIAGYIVMGESADWLDRAPATRVATVPPDERRD